MSLSFSFRSCLYLARLELANHRLLLARGTCLQEPQVAELSETRVKMNCTPVVAGPRMALNTTWSVFFELSTAPAQAWA